MPSTVLRRRESLACWIVGILCVLASARVHAHAEIPSDVVRWDAPASCPDAAWVHETIDRYVAPDHADAPRHPVRATGTITRRSDHYELVLTIDAGENASDSRTLQDVDCRLLAQAAALMVAVALDPDAAMRAMTIDPPDVLPIPPPDDPPRSIDDPAISQPPPTPTDHATAPPLDRSPPPTEPPPPAAIDRVRCRAAAIGRREPLDVRSPCIAIGLRGGLQGGVLPRPVEPGVQGEAAIVWPRIRVELGASHWFVRQLRDTMDRGGDIRLTAAHVGPCFRIGAGPIEIPLCGGVELGALRGDGQGIRNRRRDTLLWSAAVLGARLSWPFVRRVALVAHADLVVPFRRYEFAIAPIGVVHRVEPVAGRGTLGLELRLP